MYFRPAVKVSSNEKVSAGAASVNMGRERWASPEVYNQCLPGRFGW